MSLLYWDDALNPNPRDCAQVHHPAHSTRATVNNCEQWWVKRRDRNPGGSVSWLWVPRETSEQLPWTSAAV